MISAFETREYVSFKYCTNSLLKRYEKSLAGIRVWSPILQLTVRCRCLLLRLIRRDVLLYLSFHPVRDIYIHWNKLTQQA